MNKPLIPAMLLILTLLLFAGFTQEKNEKPVYVGVNKCRVCHMSKSKGNQFKVWNESKHATAYTTLGTEQSKEIAKKEGVKGDPREADECLRCHVTAYGIDEALIDDRFDVAKGVQCEACHGPGSLYRQPDVMNAVRFKKDPEGTRKLWKELGLVLPGEKECVVCHNEESPTYKPFDFERDFAAIAHPNPNISGK